MLGVTGRFLLGLYFVLPGISKITGFDGTTQYMIEHGVPLAAMLLPITIVLQIGGGAALILGWQTRAMALMLAGMTLAINLFMHDFWNVYEGLSQTHETQNFVKNLAIMAGLLALAAGPGPKRCRWMGAKTIRPRLTASPQSCQWGVSAPARRGALCGTRDWPFMRKPTPGSETSICSAPTGRLCNIPLACS